MFKFDFMCMCSLVMFSIIVEKCSWINLELLDQQDGVWVLQMVKSIFNCGELATYLYMWFYGGLLTVVELQG